MVDNLRTVDGCVSSVTNGGTLTTNVRASVPEHQGVWFDADAMTNIVGFLFSFDLKNYV